MFVEEYGMSFGTHTHPVCECVWERTSANNIHFTFVCSWPNFKYVHTLCISYKVDAVAKAKNIYDTLKKTRLIKLLPLKIVNSIIQILLLELILCRMCIFNRKRANANVAYILIVNDCHTHKKQQSVQINLINSAFGLTKLEYTYYMFVEFGCLTWK